MHDVDREIRELLGRCDDELSSPADAALLASRFANVLAEDAVLRVTADSVVDCRAFAEGAVIAAQRANWDWHIDALMIVAEYAAHHGLPTFPDVARRIHLRDPRSTRAIALWAESAETAQEVVERYLQARDNAETPAEVESLVRRYVEHSPNRSTLQPLLRRISRGQRARE